MLVVGGGLLWRSYGPYCRWRYVADDGRTWRGLNWSFGDVEPWRLADGTLIVTSFGDPGDNWQTSYRNGKRDGPYALYHDSRHRIVALRGHYRRGERDGEWWCYDRLGRRSSVEHYRDSVIHGTSTNWYEDGSIRCRNTWTTGVLCEVTWGDESVESLRDGILSAWAEDRVQCYEQYAERILHFVTNGMSADSVVSVLGAPDSSTNQVMTHRIERVPSAWFEILLDPSNRVERCDSRRAHILFSGE